MSKNIELNNKGNWVTNHPKKFVLTVFIVAIPLFILILFSINFNRKYNRVSFDTGDDKKYVYNSNISSNKKINKYIELDVTLKSIPKEVQGNYVFTISEKKQSFYSNSTITYKLLMSPDWVDYQTDPSSFTPNVNGVDRSVRFEEEIPEKRFGIFNVGRPNLYMEITIMYKPLNSDLPTNSEDIIKLYYKFDVDKTINSGAPIQIK